ncbi:hypothetical protein JHK82_051878 [Glycine max]|nr:hypothetical protein JHK86_051712 [Glycine max]KAG4937649.1 hypothetical protein JHK85_052568 [Glycine max]KAG5093100.1 hypothetical protein JHK82_051878 [Glycine max]KAH1156613.1 hypothetical protein GYH30_051420 [Glycine max]
MADAIVNFLAEKLTRLLEEEAKLLTEVHDNVTSLHDQLKILNLFLKETQGTKQREHGLVAEMVGQIRDAAYQAEDIIDTYVADMIRRRKMNRLEKVVIGSVNHALMLHKVAVKIGDIKTRIDNRFGNIEKYGVRLISAKGEKSNGEEEETERVRKQRSEVEEDKVAGFESYSRAVIEKLTARVRDRDSRLNVVSITGVGGLGKTTLARKTYNNVRVKDTFSCRAWGYVSNDYRPREFFLSLLKCLQPGEYSDMSERRESDEELKMKVRECLNKSGKYLVVVDDVWETQVWDEIKSAFPDANNGSRILITSRSTKVASYAGTTPPYSLPFLNKQKSWELLFKKLFKGRRKCPPELVELGKSIAERCDGLPLAIIFMAGILANKELHKEWSDIKDHMDWHLGSDNDNILMDILRLSYDTLPSRLKPCFLYFGMFPQGYNIPVKQLIRLWTSEGLLTTHDSSSGSRTNAPEPEYIAEQYLAELVERSLVQVIHRTSYGSVKTCRVHLVLRHFCISEARKDKFFQVGGIINDSSQMHSRRLSLQGTLFHKSSVSSTSLSNNSSVSGTRSLLCFGKEEVSDVKKDQWEWLFKSFKLARVLDLGQMNVTSLPSGLKKLIHLRYLSIHSHNLETIPDSICNLWNLETLDLRGSPIKSFSAELWQLKHLRNLLLLGPVVLPESETMPNLQTLSTVALDPRTASLLENGRFPELKKLGLHYEKRDDTMCECDPRVLLQSCLHRLSYLRKLKLIGTTEIPQNAADVCVFPSTITKITLTKFGFFNSSAMNTLGKLPNLLVLKLSSQKSDASFDLHCAAGGFSKLQVFVMVEIMVKSWRVVKGSMPSVQRVVVRNCEYLTELPEEIWSLTALCQVNVSCPSRKLAKTLQNLEVKNKRKLVVYPRSTN